MASSEISSAEIARLARDIYDCPQPLVRPLAGYDDLNFQISGGQDFVLKLMADPSELAVREAIAGVQLALAQQEALVGKVPEPRQQASGTYVQEVAPSGGKRYLLQAFSWLEGEFLGDVEMNEALLESLGQFLGVLSRELASVEALALYSRAIRWDVQRTDIDSAADARKVADPSRRRLLQYFLQGFRTEARPVLEQLPRQLLHNDANEWNVLVRDNQVSGIIDFGDMLYGPRIQELATALAYTMLGAKHPLERAVPVIRAFVQEAPLSADALGILYWLIPARLCITLIASNNGRLDGSADDYTLISEAGAWDLLTRWHRINPLGATNAFLQAAGELPQEQVSSLDLVAARKRSLSPALSLSYDAPIQMARGGLQYMFGADGRTYLDCVNNIPHVGHNHPEVVAALQLQAARLNTNTRYLYPLLTDYATQLLGHFPPGLDRVFFVNSGSAATDLAYRIAETVTRRRQWLVLEHGYHGNTRTGIGVSHYKYAGKGGAGTAPEIHEVPVPDLLRNLQSPPLELPEPFAPAAFIHETIVGCGGQLVLPAGFLGQWYALVRAAGGVCIADEVQTGFGRVGSHFWAFEQHGLVPDMVILGKPMANGHPMGAVVTTAALAEEFANGMEFFSSFGGNPVSCAAGQAVLDVIGSEGLQAQAREVGDALKVAWSDLGGEYPQIGEVRGSGLFLGIEMVREDGQFTPDAELARQLVGMLKEQGFLLSTDGPHHNVIKFKPPMCFSAENGRQLTGALRASLERLT